MASYSMLAGLGYGLDVGEKQDKSLSFGGFFEYGNGFYDTYNSFVDSAARGEGDAYYLGIGVLGRLDFVPTELKTGTGNFYFETSSRLGKLYNDFHSDDLADSSGRRAEYDSNALYYSLHAGLGFDWQINDKVSLDLYSKYFWTCLQGDNPVLSTGENLDFDAVNSHRLRIGGRFGYAYSENFNPYFGLAYEHEFDGTVSATINGDFIEEPDLKGSTGIVEVGFNLANFGNVSIDLALLGYVGQREDITGSAMLNCTF